MGSLVSGKSVKRNRELLDGRWEKHDMKDSANVADLISQGKCLYYEYPQMKLRELRALLALKRRLKRQEQALKVRIRNHLLAQYFPEFDRYFSRSESESLAIVRWCLAPSVIAGLDLVANRSGKRSDTVVPVISKNGKADLRYALYQAALIAATKNREFTIWFTNKLRGREREKGIKTEMRVKLSAKLLIIA